MFTVLIKYTDGSENLVATKGNIEFDANADGGGVLIINDTDYPMDVGENAFVMNEVGATVRKYWMRAPAERVA